MRRILRFPDFKCLHTICSKFFREVVKLNLDTNLLEHYISYRSSQTTISICWNHQGGDTPGGYTFSILCLFEIRL
uniref:Uncharacterized protein n=1 Tax=Triticum urartu TaxID=4572 RepID=A0A8R7TF89_TRIUA